MLDDNLLKRAEENDVQAIFDVAMAYFIGENVEEDNDKAFSLFCKVIALEPNFTDVYSRLGRCYENGWGTQQDFEKAIEMFTKGTQLNSSACHYYLALAYEKGEGVPRDEQKAIHHHRIASELGDADSMVELGDRYRRGIGLEKDDTVATEYYRKAADLNNANGFYELAKAYYNGLGVEKDVPLSSRLWEKSAELGHWDAQYFTGLNYLCGDGVAQDLTKAIMWLEKAARQEHADAIGKLGELYTDGIGVTKDEAKGTEYIVKAAELGHVNSMLALFHYHVDKSEYSKAAVWADRAAETGSAEGNRMAQAIHSILACADEGLGVYEEALSDWSAVKKWAEIALTGLPKDSKEYDEAQHNLNNAIYGISFTHYALKQYSESITSNTLQGTAGAILRALCIDNIATEQASQQSHDLSVTAYRVLTCLEHDVAYFNAEKREPEERVFALAVHRLAGFYTYGIANELRPDLERAVSLLYRAEQVVRNEEIRNFLASSRQRYKKKLLGGYKYE